MPTLAELQTRKAEYRAAETAILKSQDYTVSDGVIQRRNRRADLEQVRDQIAELDRQIDAISAQAAGQRRIYNIIPR